MKVFSDRAIAALLSVLGRAVECAAIVLLWVVRGHSKDIF